MFYTNNLTYMAIPAEEKSCIFMDGNLTIQIMDSDEQLIALAKANKVEFVKLYDKYFDRIYRYLLTRVADKDLAEDLTSETFYIALEKIDTFEYTGKPFCAWLYRIAINELNTYYNKNKREKEAAIKAWQAAEEKFDGADAELKESENAQEEMEKLKRLNSVFHALDEKDQEILSLKYFEDMSYQEIADVLGMTVTNVGVRLNRAVGKMTKQYN